MLGESGETIYTIRRTGQSSFTLKAMRRTEQLLLPKLAAQDVKTGSLSVGILHPVGRLSAILRSAE